MQISRVRLLVGLCALLGALLLGAAPALAGDDPYGSTTTSTEPPGDEPACTLSVDRGRPGTSVTATVTAVPLGQTVRILFDGQEVGREEETVDPTVAIDFVVPSLPPGDYLVAAVGDTFTAPCGPGEGGAFEVLATDAEPPGGGPLPRTGVYVGLLVVVAGALLLAGRAILAESKRRRRRAARAPGSRTRAGV